MLIDIKSYIVYSYFYLYRKHLLFCDFRRNSLCRSALSGISPCDVCFRM